MDGSIRVGIVGAGVLGSALARLLAARGCAVVAVSSRRFARAEALARAVEADAVRLPQEVATRSDLTLLTLPDDAIGAVAGEIARAGGWRPGHAVVHTSGALDRRVLAPAAGCGALAGVLHPLQSAADPDEAVRALPGSYFGIEAAEPLLSTLEGLVARIGARSLRVPDDGKALYHLAAALASNGVVALWSVAVDLFARAGVSGADAGRALLPLLRGTVDNLERLGLPGALTGPVARGDRGTVLRHLDALGRAAPELRALYCGLGRRMADLAVAKGSLDPEGAREILRTLDEAQVRRAAANP